MAVAQVTTIPPLFTSPYITAAEYRQSPTSVDVSNLVPRDSAASIAELNNLVSRASSWADVYCGQILAATTDTDLDWYNPGRDGWLKIHPRYTPILSVTSFAYGTTPSNLAALSDLSQIAMIGRAQEFHVPLMAGVTQTSQGPLQFGSAAYGSRLLCSYTYVNGYPTTVLATPATAGATSIQVVDATGVLAGLTQLGIYDGGQTETVKVASSYVGGTTLPLTSALRFAHNETGVSVSALPPAVKQAVIHLTNYLAKTKGITGIVAPRGGGISAGQAVKSGQNDPEDVATAYELLDPFRRVR